MATGVLKSFNRDLGLAIIRLDGRSADVALRVSGSDKGTIARLTPGGKIRFDLACSRHGQVHAVDVTPDAGLRGDAVLSGTKAGTLAEFGGDVSLEKELLSTPIIRRLIEKDGVDPLAVRRLLRSVARAAAKQHDGQ